MSAKKLFYNKHIIVAMSMAILGILYMWKGNPFISNIGSVLLVSGIYTIIDSMLLKKSLIELVVEKVGLSRDVEDTGLIKIGKGLDDVGYKEFFENAKSNIDIIHNYGRTWNSNNKNYVDEAIKRGCDIRVFLLNPNSKFVSALESHYEYKAGDLIEHIYEVENEWKKSYEEANKHKKYGTVKLYYFNGQPTNSIYRIDDKIIVINTLNSHAKDINLQYSIFRDNDSMNNLYKFYLKEIEEIKANKSTEIEL